MRIGAYEVTSTLGKGGSGIVHAARGPRGEEVALKLLLHARPDALARFKREARLQEQLGSDAGFVPLLEVGEADGKPFIAMPLLRGGTLRERLEKGPLGVAETVALGVALGEALGRAHALGIVHRDVKPENVLFAHRGAGPGDWGPPLIADLGLAKHFDGGAPGASQSLSLSATGTLRGTPAYMAPEQTRDAKNVGPEADVFALGAVVYECLTGKPAFSGQSVVEVMAKAVEGNFERLEEPAWMARILHRALAVDPAARFEDGAAFARALAQGSPRMKRSRGALAAGLIALAVLGVGASLLLLRGPPEPLGVKIDAPLEGFETTESALSVAAVARGGVASAEVVLAPGAKEVVVPAFLGASGALTAAVDLPEGAAVIEVRVHDARGGVERAQVKGRRWGPNAGDATVKKLRKEAETGSPGKMHELGLRLENGTGVKQDLAEAARWYRMAAEAGHPPAMEVLGRMLVDGRGVPADAVEATRWLRAAADAGEGHAMYVLGVSHLLGRGVPKDEAAAARWFQKGAEAGSPAAKANYGWVLMLGQGVERDVLAARRWSREAAQAGDTTGMNNYAYTIAEEEPEEAARLFRRAAELGHAGAMYNFGQKLEHGLGVARDMKEARDWYRRSAEGGYLNAMHQYAAALDTGLGGEAPDSEASIVWFRRAADGGNLQSMRSLGYMFSMGRGTPRDDAEGVRWFRKAAEGGLATAMTPLAGMLEAGRGTKKNEAEAREWLRKAAAQGDEPARAALRRLGE